MRHAVFLCLSGCAATLPAPEIAPSAQVSDQVMATQAVSEVSEPIVHAPALSAEALIEAAGVATFLTGAETAP